MSRNQNTGQNHVIISNKHLENLAEFKSNKSKLHSGIN